MSALSRVASMVAAIIAGADVRMPGDRSKRGPRHHGRRNKVARSKPLTYTRRLYAKFAKNAMERYAVGFVDDSDGSAKEARRLMRNARKQERQAERRRERREELVRR